MFITSRYTYGTPPPLFFPSPRTLCRNSPVNHSVMTLSRAYIHCQQTRSFFFPGPCQSFLVTTLTFHAHTPTANPTITRYVFFFLLFILYDYLWVEIANDDNDKRPPPTPGTTNRREEGALDASEVCLFLLFFLLDWQLFTGTRLQMTMSMPCYGD